MAPIDIHGSPFPPSFLFLFRSIILHITFVAFLHPEIMSNIPSLRKRAKRVSYAEQDSDLESEFNDRDKKLKKRKRNYHNDATDVYYPDDQTNVGTSSVRHPASLHRLPNSMPLRSALLSWYSEVHEKRGMPWRKNYDPSLDATERSQRAYEVCIHFINPLMN